MDPHSGYKRGVGFGSPFEDGLGHVFRLRSRLGVEED